MSLCSVYEKPHWRQCQFIPNPLSFNWNSQRPLTTRWSHRVQDLVTLGHPGTGLAWIRAILLFWRPLCHVSGLVRRSEGPCYWKTHLSCSAHSLLSSYFYLISRREKRPISVIFYFVIKVSGDVKRRKCAINFYPGRTGWSVDVSVPVQLPAEAMFYSRHLFCLCSLLWDFDIDNSLTGR